MDLHPGRNVYLTSWFILSVLFLTDHETSVVPTSVRDPPITRIPQWQECLPDQLGHFVCVVFERQQDICGPLHMSGIPHHMDLKPGRNIYLTSCFILSALF